MGDKKLQEAKRSWKDRRGSLQDKLCAKSAGDSDQHFSRLSWWVFMVLQKGQNYEKTMKCSFFVRMSILELG